MGLAVVDHQPEHGQRIGSAILLVGIGWTVRRGELKLEHDVGLGGIVDQLVLARGLETRVELIVAAIRVTAERRGKQPAVCPGVGDEDLSNPFFLLSSTSFRSYCSNVFKNTALGSGLAR